MLMEERHGTEVPEDMANARQVRALLESYAEGDSERFLAVAMQVAAHEARNGHGQLATELKELIDKARARESGVQAAEADGKVIRLHQPQGELSALLTLAYPTTRLSHMVLSKDIRDRLQRVLTEQRQQARLREHGLMPRHKLLLVGPPGSGKTMTAAALAGELNIGLFTIQLDGVITRFLGETAAKLRIVFDALAKTRGVYLFDEFDAIGGKRGATNDIGEARRILNSFLQFIDQDTSDSIIIAATNHPELLDRALYRRFDDVIEYDLPSQELTKQLIENRLASFSVHNLDWKALQRNTTGLNCADLVRACDEAAKEFVLSDSQQMTTDMLLKTLKERKAAHARAT